MESFPPNPTADDIRALLLTDHASVRSQFVKAFESEVSAVAQALIPAFATYQTLDGLVQGDKRRSVVTAFYYTALNSLISASQLLVISMLIPAGNLMRQFGESLAMALLCSSPLLDVFERFNSNPKHFPVDGAVHLVLRRATRRALTVNEAAWRNFSKITRFYSRFSHPTDLAITSQFMLGSPGWLAIGGQFDPAKTEQYRIELVRRRSGAEVLAHTGQALVIAASDGHAPLPPATPAA